MFLTQDLLKDSEYLHDCLIEQLKKLGKKPRHLHTQTDMYNMFDKMRYVETHKIHKLDDNLSYEFFDSGHVVGGTQLKLYFRLPNNRVKTLVYTSDLGSDYNLQFKPFVKKKDIIPSANLYVFESTYSTSDRCFSKKEAIEERKQLKKILKQRIQNGKRVFFPSFSFGRTQELMELMYEFFKDEPLFDDVPIIIDGKLTNTICNTYSKILKDEDKEKWEEIKNWKNFRYNKEYKGTMIQLAKRERGIYISSSGFIQPKTRSCDYVKNFLGSKDDLIVFVGFYGGVGSIGDRLVNSEIGIPVIIDDAKMPVVKQCDVLTYSSFSSHIQQDEIFSYWKQINADKILIHHCSKEGKIEMVEKGREELAKINKTTTIVGVSKYNYQFIL